MILPLFAKIGGGVLVVVALVAGFNLWLGKRDDAAFARGVASIERQVLEERVRADAAERLSERTMALTATLIGSRSGAQLSDLTIKLESQQKDLSREIQADRGADCRISDGVLNALRAERATVNASIAASNPGEPRPAGDAAR